MVRYMKCPRCELNYIDAEKQEYCDVCLKEMKGIRTDADEIEEEEEGEIPTELCPVCGENMMMPGEKMCEECRKKAEMEETEPDPEEDDEWREYLDDDTDDLDAEMDGMKEEFAELDEENAEDEEEEFEEEDEEELDDDFQMPIARSVIFPAMPSAPMPWFFCHFLISMEPFTLSL